MTYTSLLKRCRKLTETTQGHNGKPIIITKIIPGCIDEEEARKLVKERHESNIIRHYIIGVDKNGRLL